MKYAIAIAILCLFFSGSGMSDACTASASVCSVSCSAVAPAGGFVDCYEEDSFVECTAFDADGNTVSHDLKNCDSTGGVGSGPGTGTGGININCQIYWWTCTSFN